MFDFDLDENVDKLTRTSDNKNYKVYKSIEYDEKGNVIKIYKDNQISGSTTIIMKYNEAGKMTKKVCDKKSDGEPECIETWDYNQNGDTTRYIIDGVHEVDGKPDHIEEWEYNEEGKLVRKNICDY